MYLIVYILQFEWVTVMGSSVSWFVTINEKTSSALHSCFMSGFWINDNQQSRQSTVKRFIAVSVKIHLPCRLPRIKKSCLLQPAWTTTPKSTEQNFIVRSGKSEAKVTNNRKLCSTYCTIEATHAKHRATSLRATAELLVKIGEHLPTLCLRIQSGMFFDFMY